MTTPKRTTNSYRDVRQRRWENCWPCLAAGAVFFFLQGIARTRWRVPKKDRRAWRGVLAFRDTRGLVGIVAVIDQYCPHSGANLWLRSQRGMRIRCVYQGGKFAHRRRLQATMPTYYPISTPGT